jgi:ribosomal protein S1
LSAKKLIIDPWADVEQKFKAGQVVEGTILKVNPFGLFVKLDDDIHGLAHITQLGLEAGQKVEEIYKPDDKVQLEIISIEPKAHRLGLKVAKSEAKAEKKKVKTEKKAENKEEDKKEKAEKKEKKKPGRPKKSE